MLDAKQVDTVVRECKREDARRKAANHGAVDPTLPVRLAHDERIVEDNFPRLGEAPWSFELSGSGGLVEEGVAALVALLRRAG
jgi:hypothetical protein